MGTQADRAKRKVENKTSDGWSRPNMRKTVRKGKKQAKDIAHRARRRLGKEEAKEA